jgi:urease accessory protein
MADVTMGAGITMGEPPLTAWLRTTAWLSPGFPVGGYSYSHGVEQAVDLGLVTNAESAAAWIGSILAHGGAWTDCVLFLAASQAAERGDREGLATVAELAEAWRGTAETALESRAQGQAFRDAIVNAWADPSLREWFEDLPGPSYAIAVAVATALEGLPRQLAAASFLQAVAANLVSATVRLVPLGQTDGQRILRKLTERIPAIVATAEKTAVDDIGTATPMVDWTSMTHETQYTRLFRS